MTDFEGQVLQELSVLKSQMQQLMGIGQPGRLHQLEERVACHEQSMQRFKGVGAAFGVVMTLAQVLLGYLHERRH